jgi:hypothetical protein
MILGIPYSISAGFLTLYMGLSPAWSTHNGVAHPEVRLVYASPDQSYDDVQPDSPDLDMILEQIKLHRAFATLMQELGLELQIQEDQKTPAEEPREPPAVTVPPSEDEPPRLLLEFEVQQDTPP